MNPTDATCPSPSLTNAPSSAMRSDKIQGRHHERLAVVYVRQSTPQQVLNNQESTRAQYGLKTRATQLGWSAERVLVIDDDLGKSGASAEGRAGFQRLVTEVSLNHVGMILGIEMSRLARSCKDWHHLLEVCALFGTLIADLDGIYDPAQYNDRLLLGLKGTMSEAELHIIKQRMLQGKLQKARRGELGFILPIGYARRPSGEVILDPDEQVQDTVRLIFQKFTELGTLGGVLQYLVANRIQIGIRCNRMLGKGELGWHRPNRMTLHTVLKNPIYSGAYAYGRSQVDPRRKQAGRPKTGRVVMPVERWTVLLKDRLPAYISWEQYEGNLARLKSNQARSNEVGAVRNGPSLLSGLVVCGKCGCRLSVRYAGARNLHTYGCSRMRMFYGGEACQSVTGPAVDRFVSARVLEAVEPAALELSLEAAKHLEQEREGLTRVWRQRSERAAYEVDLAQRQYRLVEPENRLVVRQLERAWEEKLTAQKGLQEERERFERKQPHVIAEAERQAIRTLAADIPALWWAATTTDADRKEILRQVVERVVIDAQGKTERVHVTIHWVGGTQTKAEMIRPIADISQLSYYPQLCERVRTLAGEGLEASEIAKRLNAEGLRPPRCREGFGRESIQLLVRALSPNQRRSRSKNREGLGEHEWWLPELVRKIPMPDGTLHTWIARGWVKARRQGGSSGRWILWADDDELGRLRERSQQPRGFYARRYHWAYGGKADEGADAKNIHATSKEMH